jgi:hypothetical protein
MTYTPAQEAYLAAARIPGNISATIHAAAAVDAEQAATEARLNAPGALLNAALWYASQGLRVFPVRPGLKTPLTGHGFKDASTDPEKIRNWWAWHPDANIGLPTGYQFDVLDIDGPKGHQSLAELRATGLLDEPTIGFATTPHGTHLYYPPSGDGNTTALAPGIDYRGMGGYVLATPSRLADGGVYRWIEPLNLGAAS